MSDHDGDCLFIGGIADGQTRSVSPSQKDYLVSKRVLVSITEWASDPSAWPQVVPALQQERYRREVLHDGKEAHQLFIHESIPQGEAVRHLLAGYRKPLTSQEIS